MQNAGLGRAGTKKTKNNPEEGQNSRKETKTGTTPAHPSPKCHLTYPKQNTKKNKKRQRKHLSREKRGRPKQKQTKADNK